jgi:superfamily II DNA helicase RecQ
VAERFGGLIFRELGVTPDGSECWSDLDESSVFARLDTWRARVAATMGVPPYAVLTDPVLRAIADGRPRDRAALARLPGIGPRILAKFSEELLRILADSELPPGPAERR